MGSAREKTPLARSLPTREAAQPRLVLDAHHTTGAQHDASAHRRQRHQPARPASSESIDRMHSNAYVPWLQREDRVATFFREHRRYPFASSALMDPIGKAFVAAIQTFVQVERMRRSR